MSDPKKELIDMALLELVTGGDGEEEECRTETEAEDEL